MTRHEKQRLLELVDKIKYEHEHEFPSRLKLYVDKDTLVDFPVEYAEYDGMSFSFYLREGSGAKHCHSAWRPAIFSRSQGVQHYYLFNCWISQRDWFKVLEYTEEDILAHVLLWGRRDS